MVAAKYGKSDPDLKSRVGKGAKTKEISDKPMLKASTVIPTTGMIGGISNAKVNVSSRKGASR